MTETEHACLQCGQTSQEIPLIRLEYRGETYWICPQHLPLLIHKPWTLSEKLPGAEKLQPGQHD